MTYPPEGYTCHLCGETGHWIFQCKSDKKKANINKTKTSQQPSHKKNKCTHVPIPGVDPSPSDIDAAREMQKIKPPHCFCGRPSRLKKCKRSNVSATSRANGNYFFFCGAKRREEGCRFARPVEHELIPKKDRICPFFARNGSCKKGDKCLFSHKLVTKEDGKGEDKKKMVHSDAAAYIAEQQQQQCNHEQQQDNEQSTYHTEKSATESSLRDDNPAGDNDSSKSDSSSTTTTSSSNSSDTDSEKE